MAKKTIEEVREFIKKYSDGKCELISEEYINKKTPLKIRCSCGNVFERKFQNLNKYYIQCKECTNKMRSSKYRTSIDEVIFKINSTGCEYISGEYLNENSLLTIKCRCGNVFNKSFAKFSSGQDRCPECGNKKLSDSKIKYTLEDVQKVISEKGYKLLEEQYLGAHEKMRCICSKGHEFDLVFSQYLSGCSGCTKCAIAERSGTKHPNYTGGNSKVLEALRKCIDSWKKDIMELYDYECPITGEKKDLSVHHLISFANILDICSKKCNVPIHKKLKDYDDYEDFVLLKNTVISFHEKRTGILISSRIHSDFHKEYGSKNNTQEQFNEFLQLKYNTCLGKILK